MAFHPTGPDLFVAGQLETVSRAAVLVHALALVSMLTLFLGALALTRRAASPDRLAIAALVAFGFASVAGMIAATMNGFIAPGLARQIIASESLPVNQAWRIALNYTGRVNQAFAQVLVVASSIAIMLWSAAILRNRALALGIAIYGLVLGPVIVLALASGRLRLHVHGFGLVMILQSVWLITVGALMWRPKPTSSHANLR